VAPAITEWPLGVDQSARRTGTISTASRCERSARNASTISARWPVTTTTRVTPAIIAWRTPISISGTPATGVSGLEGERSASRLP
jgi:hypothetical protein